MHVYSAESAAEAQPFIDENIAEFFPQVPPSSIVSKRKEKHGESKACFLGHQLLKRARLQGNLTQTSFSVARRAIASDSISRCFFTMILEANRSFVKR
jgi:hypothetical protein